MEVSIKDAGDLHDPKVRILAVEAAAKAICEQSGQDPADAVMMLLTAAVHIATKHSDKPVRDVSMAVGNSLGHAIVAADDFFKLRKVG